MLTGFINVNKPSGITSASAVNKVKKLVGAPCGHMGTLDPLASGVLPVGIGNSTRLFNYFLDKRKTYEAEFIFGASSDTLDIEGAVEYKGRVPLKEEIEKVIPSLVGEIDQVPPKYSAKSVNGVRGYDLARKGADFVLPPKRVNIYSIELLSFEVPRARFKIECGGGTYIRSIARDMAAAAGTFAVMSALKRTQSGVFTIENSVDLDDLIKNGAADYIIKTEDILTYPTINIDNFHIFHGLPVKTDYPDGLYKIFNSEGFYGIAEVSGGLAKIKTKLC